VDHNGFFGGLRGELVYFDGSVHYFDNCNSDTFSRLWIDDFLRQLGHDITARTHVYWSPPGMEINDGLICIRNDSDFLSMTTALQGVAPGYKVLNIFVDHTDFVNNLRSDKIIPQDAVVAARIDAGIDAMMNRAGVVAVQAVPEQEGQQEEEGEERGEEGQEAEEGENAEEGEEHGEEGHEAEEGEHGEETDSEFYDSDYDAEDGDDDIF
jgi:hypothetical protein